MPNSILLGRWFGPRLPTAMSVVYSAMGGGVLALLPASQLLIDHIGWRDTYQLFGFAALGLLVPLLLLPWRLFAAGSPHGFEHRRDRSRRQGWKHPAPALPPYLEYSCCSSFRPGSAFNEQWGGAWKSL